MSETNKAGPPPKVWLYVEPGYLMLVAFAAGLLYGLLMVALDPVFRFPDVPTRFNWRDAFLTASLIGAYGALMTWLMTSYWRKSGLWIATALSGPVVAVLALIWNSLNGALGLPGDLLIFLPAALIFQALAVGLCYLGFEIARRLSFRGLAIYAVMPLVLAVLVFLGLARLRWSGPEARDAMAAINQYAQGAVVEGDYQIEFLGLRYGDKTATVADAVIYAEDLTLVCQARLFPDEVEVSCEPEDN
jgi:hypothetical protein